MPVTKDYRFIVTVGSTPSDAVSLTEQALALAGFKKVTRRSDGWGVAGVFHPILGTTWGDVRVSITADGTTTVLVVDVTAAVDNVYTLGRSPGAVLCRKYLDSLSTLTTIAGDVP